MAENSPEFHNSPILQWINKKKLHRRWRIRTLKGQQEETKPKKKQTNKIGREEEEQETAANRYPPVIIRAHYPLARRFSNCSNSRFRI
jgi:hypothetical protein